MSKNMDTRRRILVAARQLLEEGQGKSARMSDIAKLAGVSRQALYLHFKTRTDLLVATTLYLDEVKGIDQRLAASRNAPDGISRLTAFVDAWADYIPEIYGVAKALIGLQETDAEAAAAWNGRMLAVRHGCAAAIHALDRDGQLSSNYSVEQATDMLWAILSVRNWEQLTLECNWSEDQYKAQIQKLARLAFVK